MKKFFILFMMAAMTALLLSACKETLPKRFDAFVDRVEKNCAQFSEDDWTKANAQFEKLVEEFQENKAAYTAEEQKQIRSAAAKYVGLVAKSGIKTVTDAVNDAIMQIPSLLEGIGNFFKDLGKDSDEE